MTSTNFQIFDPNGFQVMSKMLYFLKNGKIIPFTDYHKPTNTFIFLGLKINSFFLGLKINSTLVNLNHKSKDRDLLKILLGI